MKTHDEIWDEHAKLHAQLLQAKKNINIVPYEAQKWYDITHDLECRLEMLCWVLE